MAQSVDLLKTLTNADAVPGYEREVTNIFRDHLTGIGELKQDKMGGISCMVPGRSASPRVLIDSHVDEVGFMVQRVTSAGFIKFINLGGWWPHTLLAQKVRILSKINQQKVIGIIGSTPPHLLGDSAKSKVLDINDLYIDVGAENQRQAEDEYGIRPGCPVVPATSFQSLKNPKLYAAKALDNRIAVALVIETLKELAKSSNHPNTIIGVGSVQEEVGVRGAITMTEMIQPDVAIVLEAPPADDLPGFEQDASQGRLGGGCQIRLFDPTHIANPILADLVIEIAAQNAIPHQIAVRNSGGTNAAAIHKSRYGIPTIVLGIPTRYIHSHISIMNIDDYNSTKALLLLLLQRLSTGVVGKLV